MCRALKSVLVLGVLTLAAPMALAADRLTLQPSSKLWLTGSSTMHDYSSTASKLSLLFEHEPLDPTLEIGDAIETLISNLGVSSIEVIVPVMGLRSGKDGLDKNMYKALLAPKHPEIRFVMTAYDALDGLKPGEMSIKAKGTLSIAGVEREMAITVIALREGDAVRLRGRVPLMMTQFGIKPPNMMMGTLRTKDDVVVRFDLLIGATSMPVTTASADTEGASQW